MSPTFYHLLHVISLLVLFGYTFYAFAAPAETRKRVLIITGIASLVMLVGGFGLITKLKIGFPGWIIVKIVCWLGLSAIAGMAYKRRAQANTLMLVTLALAIIAVVMVYLKPF
jgi:predicted nucleic acid-binding Zn ribbon protein